MEKILIILLPSTILLTNFIVPSGKNDGAIVKSRPEPWFFGLIWTTIVIGLSVSWWLLSNIIENKNHKNIINILFVALIVAANLWQYVYHEIGKKQGVWSLWITVFCGLALTLISSILICKNTNNISSIYLSIPIIMSMVSVWAIYASVMNMIEVQEEP